MASRNDHVPGDIDSFAFPQDISNKHGKAGKDPDITLSEFLERLLWKLLAGTAVALVAAIAHPYLVDTFIADPKENVAAAVLLFNLDVFTYICLLLFLVDPKSPGWPFVKATIAFFATKLSPLESPSKVDNPWNDGISEMQCNRCQSGRTLLIKGPDSGEMSDLGLSGFKPEASSTPRTAQSSFLDGPESVRDYHCDSQEFTVLTSGPPSPEVTSPPVDVGKRADFSAPSCVLILANPPTLIGHEAASDGDAFTPSQSLMFDSHRIFNISHQDQGPPSTAGEETTSLDSQFASASNATNVRGQTGPVHKTKLKDEESTKMRDVAKAQTVCAPTNTPTWLAPMPAGPSFLDASAPEFRPRSAPPLPLKQVAPTSLTAKPEVLNATPTEASSPTSDDDKPSTSSIQSPGALPPPFEFTFTMKAEATPASPRGETTPKMNDFPCIYPSTLSPTNSQPAFSPTPQPATSLTAKLVSTKPPLVATSETAHPLYSSSRPVYAHNAKPSKIFAVALSSSTGDQPKNVPAEQLRTGLHASIHAPRPASSPAIVVTPSTPEVIDLEVEKKPFDPVIARPTLVKPPKPVAGSAPAKVEPVNVKQQKPTQFPTASSSTFTPPQSPPPIPVQAVIRSSAIAQLLVPDEQRGHASKAPASTLSHGASPPVLVDPPKRLVPKGPRHMAPARSASAEVEVITEKKQDGITKGPPPTPSQPSLLSIEPVTAIKEHALALATTVPAPANIKALEEKQDGVGVATSIVISQPNPSVSVEATCPPPSRNEKDHQSGKAKSCVPKALPGPKPKVAPSSTVVKGACSTPRRAPQSRTLANKSTGRSPGIQGSIWATNILALSSNRATTTTQVDTDPPISVQISVESKPISSSALDAPPPAASRTSITAACPQAPAKAILPPKEAQPVKPRKLTTNAAPESSSTPPLTQRTVAKASISYNSALRYNQVETRPILDRPPTGSILSKNKPDTASTEPTQSIKPVEESTISGSNTPNSVAIEQLPNSYITPKTAGTVLQVPGAPVKPRWDAKKHGPRKSDPGSTVVAPPSTGDSSSQKETSDSKDAKNALPGKTKSARLNLSSSDINEQFQSNAAVTKPSTSSGPTGNSAVPPNGPPTGTSATLQNLIKRIFTSSTESKIIPEASSGKSLNERIGGGDDDDAELPGVEASMWAPGRADKASISGPSRAPADAKIGAWRSHSVGLKKKASSENWRVRDTLLPIDGKK